MSNAAITANQSFMIHSRVSLSISQYDVPSLVETSQASLIYCLINSGFSRHAFSTSARVTSTTFEEICCVFSAH